MEKDYKWEYVESLLRELLANEKWNVMTAADAKEQEGRKIGIIEKIQREYAYLAEDAWKYRDLQN